MRWFSGSAGSAVEPQQRGSAVHDIGPLPSRTSLFRRTLARQAQSRRCLGSVSGVPSFHDLAGKFCSLLRPTRFDHVSSPILGAESGGGKASSAKWRSLIVPDVRINWIVRKKCKTGCVFQGQKSQAHSEQEIDGGSILVYRVLSSSYPSGS